MAKQTNYEVHVYQGGRWSIHARFDSGEKDEAIEEAKSLEVIPGITEVKVIREIFDTVDGSNMDFVIYRTIGAKSETSKGRPKSTAPQQASRHSSDDEVYFEEEENAFGDLNAPRAKPQRGPVNKKKTTLSVIVIKLLLIILFSVCAAAFFSVLTSSMLSGTTLFGHRIVGHTESNLLFIIFVGTFLITAAFMANSLMRTHEISSGPRKPRPRPRPKPSKAKQKKVSSEKRARETEKRKKEKAENAKQEEELHRQELDESMKGIGDFKTEAEPDSEPVEHEPQPAPEEPESPPAAADGTPVLSKEANEQKEYMMAFLNEAITGSNKDQKNMDNFNKFGVNLFLAGSCETLCDKRNLDVGSRERVLAESVKVMGFKKSHAKAFSEKYEEYLMADPRYMQMFQAGRNALNTYLTDKSTAPKQLDMALAEWNKPKQKEEQSGPISVLFTDIAGSTAMTQSLGDAGAQEVVRAHNRVVREALTMSNGKEIKHTGDGIMASFAKTTDSVDAAIYMQRETMKHNEQFPALPLHLKIGINAGEPIMEDNDLFGSTVQMSARIVDKAQADEIFISEVVKGICAGKSYEFVNRGGYAMKGFEDDPILYEVVWRQ